MTARNLLITRVEGLDHGKTNDHSYSVPLFWYIVRLNIKSETYVLYTRSWRYFRCRER
jgi:hypothetical protein